MEVEQVCPGADEKTRTKMRNDGGSREMDWAEYETRHTMMNKLRFVLVPTSSRWSAEKTEVG